MAVPWYEEILDVHVHESPGSLFDSPDGSALIHACNCMGVWGSGIANDFRERASGPDIASS
ncbi:ADP-ribose 1''-phosphate phosphatase, partial [Elasticomyces elasticus]